MNKNAIKKFAIDARNKLIASVTDKAGMLGITKDACSEPITKGVDFEVYKTTAGTEVTLNKKQCEHRRKLVEQIKARGFDAVIEEEAYTWFNRICAIRFMEVNDYMYPARVRVLSSEKAGKNEPDILTLAPDIDWEFTEDEREYIIDAKMNNKLDDLFRMLFIKQCNLLHEVLPGLFEETEDYTEMLLNISFTNEDDVIRMLVDEERGIPEQDFNVSTLNEEGNPTGQVEIIGWLYQYYNTELKDDTFAKLKKNIKITKERIPAATQLFTPDWIVRYMVENSVGRIWIEHLRSNDPSMDEKATAERFGWKYYLPEAEQEDEVNVKLAEIRTTYKDLKPTDITCIDPCMGSGHILIAMFDVLMDIYESAGYDKREAAFDIVEHNIHGLDIDKRAYQLAYFAVMMKGRGYNRRFFRGRDDVKPVPKVYAIMESNDIEMNHLQFFGTSMSEADRTKALEQVKYLLYTFVDAREYGSILNVNACDWELLDRFVNDLDDNGQITFEKLGSDETKEKLQKLIKIAEVMGEKYDAVVTNPPYMGSKQGMNAVLKDYLQQRYSMSKSDLYAVFMELCYRMCKTYRYVAMINQHGWMFLSSYSKLRKFIVENTEIISMIHLGTRAFDEIGGEVVQTTSFIMCKDNVDYSGNYVRLIDYTTSSLKKEHFLDIISKSIKQDLFVFPMKYYRFLPDNLIGYWISTRLIDIFNKEKSLAEIAKPRQGLSTSDNARFLRLWYETDINNIGFNFKSREEAMKSGLKWFPYNKGGEYRKWYGNNNYVINWQNDGEELREWADYLNTHGTSMGRLVSQEFYFRKGITWSGVGATRFGVRCYQQGMLFDVGANGLFVDDDNLYYYLAGFLNTKIANEMIKVLNPTINTGSGTVGKLPVIIANDRLSVVGKYVKRNIEIAKNAWDSNETSWDFKRHPLMCLSQSVEESINIWINKCKCSFNEMRDNEKVINEIFINLYGLKNDFTADVNEEDVSLAISTWRDIIISMMLYAVGCMFGRYSLNEEGLIYAGGEWDSGRYTTFQPDVDNIIPITDEEYFEDDIVSRFCDWLKIAFGAKSFDTNMDFIAKVLGNKGDTSREVIRNYFLNDFFKDHCNTYSVTGSGKRPIYWLFDSGKQNGFKALIYMHRYDADTVGRVRTDYLHKAQKHVETAMQGAQYTLDNASSSLEKSKATKSITKYTKQLAEMQIYDEAIAHIANQRIEIDLDDGVKVNYAKFQGVEVAQEGKKALKVDLLAKI